MRRALGCLFLLAVLAGCTPTHHLYPSFYDHTVDERYLIETPYDRYWDQNHAERFGFRFSPIGPTGWSAPRPPDPSAAGS